MWTTTHEFDSYWVSCSFVKSNLSVVTKLINSEFDSHWVPETAAPVLKQGEFDSNRVSHCFSQETKLS